MTFLSFQEIMLDLANDLYHTYRPGLLLLNDNNLRYDTIGLRTIEEFNLDSKAEYTG